MKKKHFGLILAGGQGTRFWPWSTEHKPKQFLDIVGDTPLITQTYERLKKIMPAEHIFVVADNKYLALVKEAIPGFKDANFVDEPCPKNTAPGLILANIALAQLDDDANVAVVPADHYIPDSDVFAAQIRDALDYADNKFIITSGIRPNMPHTGYGYIQFDGNDPVPGGDTRFHALTEFKEKPPLETAQKYLDDGNYYWNSGMFFYNLKHMKDFFKQYSPYYYEQYLLLEEAYADREKLVETFKAMKPESIDYALMEKVKEVKMFKARFTWNDVGAWTSVFELSEKDEDGNAAERKNNVFLDSKNSLIFSTDEKPIAVIGLENIAVINTENGILISTMDDLQKVKQASQKVAESSCCCK
ncbi:MAG: mannose-1-phosphate guanylyltransferase [bacterium]|nr:mannose-1-phosphate guanylyltransferase [bacterium]